MQLLKDHGFTLVEILIVVIILGVLAGVVIPRFADTAEETCQATLTSDLTLIRKAIELYYHQHNATYPGAIKAENGNPVPNDVQAAKSFVKQLTEYSSAYGKTSKTKDSTYRLGPYLKRGIPPNPCNGENGITCNISESDIAVALSSGSDGTGWKFYVLTGRFIANDGNHDSF